MDNKFLKLFLIILCVTFFGCSSSPTVEEMVDETVSEITYDASSDVISNPERGFMHTWSVDSEGDALTLARLENLKNENVSIILRLYYLNSFKNSDLSAAQLDLMKTDFERLRSTGVKCILRFAYNSSLSDTDAPLTIVERHLDQLKPLFAENQDVIAFLQAGFIGSWGEWHNSSNGLTSLENKKAVLEKILEVLPTGIKVQVRTPLHKQEIFDYSTALSAGVGYGTTDIARVGFHNDCFLASIDDYGTYQNVAIEKSFVSQEAFFVPTGGETCPPSGIPSASCNTAETEMELLKWTYLNLDYYGPVIQIWKSNSCFTDFQRRLGYRLILKSSELIKEATTNDNFQLSAVFSNVGFAPVYNTKNAFLVFKSKSNGTFYKKSLNLDVRKIVPGVDYKLEESVSLSGIPVGNYELFLKIEDSNNTLSDRLEYSIQLANKNTWDSTEGINSLLHTLIIN